MYRREATFARTIPIPTLGVGTTEFEITPARVEALYQSGYDAAVKFLDGFDFKKYIDAYREAEPPGRQEQIQGTATQPAPGTRHRAQAAVVGDGREVDAGGHRVAGGRPTSRHAKRTRSWCRSGPAVSSKRAPGNCFCARDHRVDALGPSPAMIGSR